MQGSSSKELGLEVNADLPLFAVISRLTEQKGMDLITYNLPMFESGKMQLAVLEPETANLRKHSPTTQRRIQSLLQQSWSLTKLFQEEYMQVPTFS